jgi:hypothetical protein
MNFSKITMLKEKNKMNTEILKILRPSTIAHCKSGSLLYRSLDNPLKTNSIGRKLNNCNLKDQLFKFPLTNPNASQVCLII